MAAKMYSTPGVYIEEKDAFSRSVVPVATAVPCFVGFTEKAVRNNEPVTKILVKVKSLGDYARFFGGAPQNTFTVALNGDGSIGANPQKNNFYLFNSLKAYFANGGGDCYIYSIGGYDTTSFVADDFKSVLKPLENEPEPTLIVMPDAHLIESSTDYYSIWQEVLPHCKKMINRFAILDIHNKGNFADISNPDEAQKLIDAFKSGIGTKELAYGAVYWPWIQTTVVSPRDINFKNIANWDGEIKEQVKTDLTDVVSKMTAEQFDSFFPSSGDAGGAAGAAFNVEEEQKKLVLSFVKLLHGSQDENSIKYLQETKLLPADNAETELAKAAPAITFEEFDPGTFATKFSSNLSPTIPAYKETFTALADFKQFLADNAIKYISAEGLFKTAEDAEVVPGLAEAGQMHLDKLKTAFTNFYGGEAKPIDGTSQQHNALIQLSPLYKAIMNKVRDTANIMPASSAMAGIYKYVDSDRGTHQSPANISVSSVGRPLLTINDQGQESLNIPIDGKAINVIRSFPGKGILVWGARTMDGNSQDWRYISVRRTVSMIELSVKYAAEAYVFEPNNASTWSNIQSMISNFLTNMWQGGALAGTTPGEAFSVSVGLGSTMSSVDILDGYMRIMVKVAVTRPAEFIVITFQQQMQTS